MRWVCISLMAVLLAGCGADGEPEQPTRNATVTLSDRGAALQTTVSQGPVSLTLGLGL